MNEPGATNERDATKSLLSALALSATIVLYPATADAQDQPARRALTYAEWQDKINAWTVGLAAGLLRVRRCGWAQRPPTQDC
jgi:hypothetical protein